MATNFPSSPYNGQVFTSSNISYVYSTDTNSWMVRLDTLSTSTTATFFSLYISSTAESFSTTTGAVVVAGGIGLGLSLTVGKNATIRGNSYVYGDSFVNGLTTFTTATGLNLNLSTASITSLTVDSGNISNIVSTAATITTGTFDRIVVENLTLTNLQSTSANITNLTVASGNFTTATTVRVVSNSVTATTGFIGILSATTGTINNIAGSSANISNLIATNFVSSNINVSSLQSVNITATTVTATTVSFSSLRDSLARAITKFDIDGTLAANSDSNLSTQKAIKTYVDWTKDYLIGLINALQGEITGFVSVPSGSVFYVARQTAPNGYLVCNGSSVSTTAYPTLFAAIGYTFGGSGGNFNLPDLRGEFIRGWDNGRTVDSGRTFGSSQNSSMGPHNHFYQDSWDVYDAENYTTPLKDAYNNYVPYVESNGRKTVALNDQDAGSYEFTRLTQSTGTVGISVETRPRNIALLPIIKI